MSESSNELIIDPELLASIQRQCRQLEAAESAAAQSFSLSAPATPVMTSGSAVVAAEEEAQRFAAAIDQMPPKVRAFFEREEPVPAWRVESAQDRTERLSREAIGCWCG